MIPRSYLYVSGGTPERFQKAVESGADAVIVDLEDSVIEARKGFARDAAAEFAAHFGGGDQELWIRVNPGEAGRPDLEALATLPGVTGICLPKAEMADDIDQLNQTLAGLAADLPIEPLLESASSILQAQGIASVPGVRRLHIGEFDLAANLGFHEAPDEIGMGWARGAVVIASSAAGSEPPIGPVTTDFRDVEAFRKSTLHLKQLGFWGRACIHPSQIPVANEAFTPSVSEIEWAEDVLERLKAAGERGGGATTGSDGKLVDEAVAKSARRILAQDPLAPARSAAS